MTSSGVMVCMEMDMENGLPVILCFYAVAKFFFCFFRFLYLVSTVLGLLCDLVLKLFHLGTDSEVVYLLCLIFYFCVFLVCKRAYTVRRTPF